MLSIKIWPMKMKIYSASVMIPVKRLFIRGENVNKCSFKIELDI